LKRLTGTTGGLKSQTVLNTYKVFLRPVLTYGFTAWISAALFFYHKVKVLERHALRTAFRIRLPSPTAELYDRTPFPHILYHLEQLRLKYIRQRLESHHPLLFETLHDIVAVQPSSIPLPRFSFPSIITPILRIMLIMTSFSTFIFQTTRYL